MTSDYEAALSMKENRRTFLPRVSVCQKLQMAREKRSPDGLFQMYFKASVRGRMTSLLHSVGTVADCLPPSGGL